MVEINWEVEHERFMRVAYPRTLKAAERAFSGWHISKQRDAIATCTAKMWCQWSRLLLRGRNPEPMLSGLIKYALLLTALSQKSGSSSGVPGVTRPFQMRRLSPHAVVG